MHGSRNADGGASTDPGNENQDGPSGDGEEDRVK